MAIKTDFFHQLERLSLIINKRVTSSYTGERKSLATGRGIVFKDYTMYAPGDDFRTIDWRVFARTDKLWVRRFEEERNLTVHVILDFSNSMSFSSHRSYPSKYYPLSPKQRARGFASCPVAETSARQ